MSPLWTLPQNIGTVNLQGGSLSGTGATGMVSTTNGVAGTVNPGNNGHNSTDTGILYETGGINFSASNSFFVNLKNLAAVQTITLTGPIPGSTQFTLSVNGVTSPAITYSGSSATDASARPEPRCRHSWACRSPR